MNYQSLLELLAQEDAICRKLQVKINILSAIRQVEDILDGLRALP